MSKYEPRLPYYEIQRQALRKGWNKPGFGYLLEMGLGKSYSMCNTMSLSPCNHTLGSNLKSRY